MKKIVFCLYNLDYGGIETAFINLTNKIDYKKYEVSLILEKCNGVFLKDLNENVKVIDYNISTSNNIFVRKIINRLKLIKFIILNYNKYDFSACFATSRKVGSILARYLSKNNCLFVHGNYYNSYEEGIEFLDYVKAYNFQKIVFVSNELKNKYLSIYPDTKQLLYVSNNLINEDRIIKLSLEKNIKKDKLTFIHIGRHKEDEKNIMMLLEAIKKLSLDKINFKLYMIGDGINHADYKEKVEKLGLSDYVDFLGSLDNPYPYLKISDALLLTSPKEGNPVVFLEAKVLGIPIITTDVSDSKLDIDNSFGLVTKHSVDSFYFALKEFCYNGFLIKKQFDAKEYNLKILKNIDKVIGD